jgi:hypothetical protein
MMSKLYAASSPERCGMKVLRLLIMISLTMFFGNVYAGSDNAAGAVSSMSMQHHDTLGGLIKKHLMGYWVRIKDVSAKPIWFANLSPVRYAHHRVYICGAGDDYVVLCYPNGMFYSAIPTIDVRLGGLYTDPWYAVDLCKIGYHCSPPLPLAQ